MAFNEKAKAVRGDVANAPSKEYLDYLRLGAEYMESYCDLSGYDSFKNLLNVCSWYQELGAFEFSVDAADKAHLEKARGLYQKLLKVFGNDAQYKESIQNDVYKDYATLLNTLREFPEAKPLWQRLLKANPKNVTILRNTAFCYGGWVDCDGRKCTEVNGTGDYAPPLDENRDPKKISLNSAYDIWNYLLRGIRDRGEKYSDDWWEAKFYTVFCLYRAGAKDPGYVEQAKKILENQKIFTPEMGGRKWRPQFNYLEREMK